MTGDERLLVLAAALENDAADPTGMKFDLTFWMQPDNFDEFIKDTLAARHCGTAGCAVGLAMILPELQAEGLHPARERGFERGGYVVPTYKQYQEFDAVNAFFEISHYQASYLFIGSSYWEDAGFNIAEFYQGSKAELSVAARIRDFVSQPRAMRMRENMVAEI